MPAQDNRVAEPQVAALATGSYLLGDQVEVRIRNDPRPLGDQSPPVTPVVLLSPQHDWTSDHAIKAIESFYQRDDVFCDDFLSDTMIIQASVPEKAPSIRWPELRLQRGQGKWSPSHVIEIEDHSKLPQGPYFLKPGNILAQAWKLYPDTQDAFATAVVPVWGVPSRFQAVESMSKDGLWRQIAVPSRLYANVSASKPLAGKRISVKDNFKVAGIKTTQSNRGFVATYGPEQETAKFMEKLVSLGAVIVGKTKMCAFASSEEATDQWIDFHAPFNPRGDGYQSPSGSTTGGAAGLAAYSWLDFSVGTDTTGSIRWPAAWNGLFGMRTSWGTESLEGVYPSCRVMDTIGLLSRDASQLQALARASLPSRQNKPALPKRILYPTDFFPHSNPGQQALVEEFIQQLEGFLGIERTNLSIAERWNQCPPEEAAGKGIREYINKTAYYPFYYDGYNEFSKFRKDHEDKFGKPVYVGPYMRWKWNRGAEVTHDQKEQALGELEVYRRWFENNIMRAEPDGGSDAILLLPCGSGEPKYRDLPNAAPGVVPSFSPNYIASMLGLPQIVLPVGQVPYESRISRRAEYLPVVASMAGAPGSDHMLLRLAKDVLESAGKPTAVETGRFMFKI